MTIDEIISGFQQYAQSESERLQMIGPSEKKTTLMGSMQYISEHPARRIELEESLTRKGRQVINNAPEGVDKSSLATRIITIIRDTLNAFGSGKQ